MIIAAVKEPGGPGGFVIGHLLGPLELAAVPLSVSKKALRSSPTSRSPPKARGDKVWRVSGNQETSGFPLKACGNDVLGISATP